MIFFYINSQNEKQMPCMFSHLTGNTSTLTLGFMHSRKVIWHVGGLYICKLFLSEVSIWFSLSIDICEQMILVNFPRLSNLFFFFSSLEIVWVGQLKVGIFVNIFLYFPVRLFCPERFHDQAKKWEN